MAATMQPTRADDAQAPVLGAAPLHAEPDDIADPEVPPAVMEAGQPPTPEWQQHEALLQGFCQHLLHRLDADLLRNGKQLMRTIDAMGMAMKAWIEKQLAANEHSQYQLSDALRTLQDRGLVVVQNPYQATIQVRSPQGYPVTVQLAKREASELLDALGVLLPWLQGQGYAALESAQSPGEV
jgi:hypothetical protein